MADPASFQLGPEGAADDEETVVWDVMYTTGSSGTPAPFVSTAYDFVNILALNRNMLRLRGVTAGDSILNLFPLTKYPHGAFIRVLHAASSMNIPVVSAMPGRENARRPELNNGLDEVVALAARTRPTILWGVPSYIRRLVGRAEEMGVKLPSVRLVFVTGEGFGEEARADMIARLERLGASSPWISVSYGATEMQGGLVECAHGSGYHNPAPDQFLFEAVDPETHEPVADGDEGLILLTHLDRRGTVMLRYALGDVARLARGKCPHCGALHRAHRQHAAAGRRPGEDQRHAGQSAGAGRRAAGRTCAARFSGRGGEGKSGRAVVDGSPAASDRRRSRGKRCTRTEPCGTGAAGGRRDAAGGAHERRRSAARRAAAGRFSRCSICASRRLRHSRSIPKRGAALDPSS